MPGYGVARNAEGMLPWSWAEERLRDAHNYYVGTTDGEHPHLMPVWGLWLDGRFLFSTGTSSKKARNLAGNPNLVIATERADEAVILEGTAAETADRALLDAFVREYKRKYDWDMDAGAGGIFEVRPRVAVGFIEHADQFGKTATRWVFGEGGG
jgi:hypothetical protein